MPRSSNRCVGLISIIKTKWADHVGRLEKIRTAQKILEDTEIRGRIILRRSDGYGVGWIN